jgi:hypothetical protein
VSTGATGMASPVGGTVRTPQAPAPSAPRVPVQATVPMAMAAESNAAHRSSRGVYMVLGAVIAVAILFAAGFYVPRWIKTHASPGSTAPTSATQPVTQPADAPVDISAPPPDAVPVAAVPEASPQEDPAVVKARQDAERKAREEAARKAALLKEAEQQSDQLEARSAAIEQGLDNLRRAQSAQGYGLRGDIVAAETTMKINLARGQSALRAGDGAQAKEYLDKAETQAMILERFQGR